MPRCLPALLFSVALSCSGASLRGRLLPREGKAPALAVSGKLIALEGDKEITAVLNDRRLAGAELEVTGRFKTPELFFVAPYTNRDAVFLHKNGKKYTISYWCEVCAIRTYAPGKCMCCQEETQLSLEDVQP